MDSGNRIQLSCFVGKQYNLTHLPSASLSPLLLRTHPSQKDTEVTSTACSLSHIYIWKTFQAGRFPMTGNPGVVSESRVMKHVITWRSKCATSDSENHIIFLAGCASHIMSLTNCVSSISFLLTVKITSSL